MAEQIEASQATTVAMIGATELAPFGLAPPERLRRALARHGLGQFLGAEAALPDSGAVLLLRADTVYDEAMAEGLARPADFFLIDEQGRAVAARVGADRAAAARALIQAHSQDRAAMQACAGAIVGAADLAGARRKNLRTRQPPYILHLPETGQAAAERQMYRAAYKGVTDFVTKWLWPLPALWATRFCARRGISPNTVTLVSLGCVIAATAFFYVGWFAIGLVFAWAMTFLDTVDGKLARVTLTSSTWGEVFDHGVDHIHPPFWYAAWWYGLKQAGIDSSFAGALDASLWIVIGGYVLGRLQEGLFLWRFKMEMHVWRRFDSLFRLITARRNPNLAILTGFTVAGQPGTGFAAIALWTILSLAFHFMRIGQAFAAKKRDGALRSWLDEAAPA